MRRREILATCRKLDRYERALRELAREYARRADLEDDGRARCKLLCSMDETLELAERASEMKVVYARRYVGYKRYKHNQ